MAAVVADVVGKGIPASVLSASVCGALRATAESCDDLGELLTGLHRHVWRETLLGEFVTLLLVAVDVETRQLTYCSAGHEPLFLLRDGEVQRISGDNSVLGLSGDERYEQHTLAMRPNDLLLLYTDGVTDSMDFDDQLFGRERLAESLIRYGSLPADQVLHNILWDTRRFVGLADQADDLTMIAVRMRG